MNNNHDFNQCANDWITCKCGKVFGDDKESLGKEKFLKHLRKNDVNPFWIKFLDEQIVKKDALAVTDEEVRKDE